MVVMELFQVRWVLVTRHKHVHFTNGTGLHSLVVVRFNNCLKSSRLSHIMAKLHRYNQVFVTESTSAFHWFCLIFNLRDHQESITTYYYFMSLCSWQVFFAQIQCLSLLSSISWGERRWCLTSCLTYGILSLRCPVLVLTFTMRGRVTPAALF